MSRATATSPSTKRTRQTGSRPGPQPEAWAVALLRWFSSSARDLPWRRTLDPYAIWVSEIMLQQTQVATVIPYWQRWMKRFPTVGDLAKSPPDSVLKHWEGLGYYSRARNLQRSAILIVERHCGRFPSDPEAIEALPGIGRYTSGAVQSIAFNRPVPILDGNVVRVLTRLMAVDGDPKERSTNGMLWSWAQELVQAAAAVPPLSPPGCSGNCSALNQSLMELGATVCRPRSPSCDACPLRRHCRAYSSGTPERYPASAPRAAATARFIQAFVVEQDGRVWVGRRREGVVNSGLWEFPGFELPSRDSLGCSATLGSQLVTSGAAASALVTVKHSITRYRITLQAHHLLLEPGVPLNREAVAQPASGAPEFTTQAWAEARWVDAGQARRLAFSGAHSKLLRAWLQKTEERKASPSPATATVTSASRRRVPGGR